MREHFRIAPVVRPERISQNRAAVIAVDDAEGVDRAAGTAQLREVIRHRGSGHSIGKMGGNLPCRSAARSQNGQNLAPYRIGKGGKGIGKWHINPPI